MPVLSAHSKVFNCQWNYKTQALFAYIYIPAKFPANCPGKVTAEFNSNNVLHSSLNDVQILFPLVPVLFIYCIFFHRGGEKDSGS